MRITFYGAAGTVTGSKHLIETETQKILLDCGLFQEGGALKTDLNRHFPFEGTDISNVILSHAHADHCAMLPILVKKGFTGSIYATNPTIDISELIMGDSARIQAQNALEHNLRLKPDERPIDPIYIEADIPPVMRRFVPVSYFSMKSQWQNIDSSTRFKFYDAGHILGSAVTVLEHTTQNKTLRVGFTGDLGRPKVPILRDPEYITEPLDLLISEATYGMSTHKPLSEAVHDLVHIVKMAIKHKSKIIIPSFALGRTQELVYILHVMLEQNLIPAIPIYVDSPLSVDISGVFRQYSEYYDTHAWKTFYGHGGDPLVFKNLRYVREPEQSKLLNAQPGPCIIIASSGMCEGGRVLHHLKHSLERPENIVVLVGYQAHGTLGRLIQNGVSPVRILGQSIEPRAQIFTIGAFSAHADQTELLQYFQHSAPIKKIALVHTEPEVGQGFKTFLAKSLPKTEVVIPHFGQTFEI